MNGYLSPCAGEPCPPVFRSPVESMEDIMDNQVMYVFQKFICSVYLINGHILFAFPCYSRIVDLSDEETGILPPFR